MNVKVTNLAFDCADLDVMARFWGSLLDMKVTARDDGWLDLEPLGEGGPVLSFQKVPEGKTLKNRIHLDLHVPELATAATRAQALGASPASGPYASFQVWRDPEGNEFCFTFPG
jgi:catechol-2,3-dioxygenase